MFFDNNHYDLLVVGNGYDIACGFPTRYCDFYEALVLYKNNVDDLNSFLLAFKSKYKVYDIEKIKNLYFSLSSISKENYFYKYFLAYNKVFEKWCDFETELANILISFDSTLSKLTTNDYNKIYTFDIDENIKTLNIFHRDFVPRWKGFAFNNLDSFTKGVLVDNNYNGKYSRFDLLNRIGVIKTMIIEGLSDDLKDFKNIFIAYLECVLDLKSKIPQNIACENLISFNYTHICENTILVGDTFYIHGVLEDHIIFGIDSSLTFKDRRFRSFTKLSQKAHLSKTTNLNAMLLGVTSIAYFGLSFEMNDKDVLSVILNTPDATHYIYYHEDLDTISGKIEEIIGSTKYGQLENDGKLVYIPSDSIVFKNK